MLCESIYLVLIKIHKCVTYRFQTLRLSDYQTLRVTDMPGSREASASKNIVAIVMVKGIFRGSKRAFRTIPVLKTPPTLAV